MDKEKPSAQFWLGNGVLAVALLMLLAMGRLWEVMGSGAMVLWVVVVAIGVYLLASDKGGPGATPG
jgi:hypothetical protein